MEQPQPPEPQQPQQPEQAQQPQQPQAAGFYDPETLRGFYAHFEEHGWAILPQAIPLELANKAVAQTTEILKRKFNFDTQDQNTWDSWPFDNNGFAELVHVPAFYEIRFFEPLYDVYRTLYGTDRLRLVLDRCCIKRPLYVEKNGERIERQDWHHRGFFHHDMNLLNGFVTIPIQSVLALDDTQSEIGGGWQGFDRFHKMAAEWVKKAPNNYKKRLTEEPERLPIFFPDPDKFKHLWVRPEMHKGDLLVWKSEITHGSGPNNSTGRLRFAMYPNVVPTELFHPKEVTEQIKCWKDGTHPAKFPAKWTNLEIQDGTYQPYPVESLLQRRLLGLEEWY